MNKDEFEGIYKIYYHPDYSKLELKKDGNFNYFISGDLVGNMNYSGKWKRKGKIITLTVKSPELLGFNDNKSYVTEKFDKNLINKIKIKVFYKDSIPFVPVNIFINDNTKSFYTTDNKGIALIPFFEKRIKSISLESLFGTDDYEVKNKKSNYFIFYNNTFNNISLLLRNDIVPLKWEYNKKNYLQPFNEKGKIIKEFYYKQN